GPNGAGKTTTFNMIVGLVRPEEGRILLRGEDVTRCPMFLRARLGVGYLSQESSVFRKLTVEENVLAVLERQESDRGKREERLAGLLDELGIAHLASQKAFRLSGGEARRLEIARALVTQPSFMLLDEPFAGIDPITVSDIQGIVRQLAEKGLGVLITDHNVRETLSITHRSYIMFEGQILLSGTAAELASSEQARSVYLGEQFTL
ncbi:MAG: LPS export ABC transporter ATP-binding protein, partial [Candidatus Eisenbacteria sp.]|nr:LPS export ABC transporter ATP-binding protein [Candidatus Eisenbacteria bacterium]